jgi:hypothetical protein
VRRTVLFHHDPTHDDEMVDDLVVLAQARAAGRTEVIAGAEGMDLVVEPRDTPRSESPSRSRTAATVPALAALAAGVLVFTTDDELRQRLAAAAEAEGLELLAKVSGGQGDSPVVVVVDLDGGDPFDGRSASPSSWVLGVVRRLPAAVERLDARINDWLVWPAGTAHVRTKLRAAVLRRACQWLVAATPADEQDRLAALQALEVLDTPAEGRFDRLTERACQLFDVPVSLITLVDSERQWFKSHTGIDIPETHRDESVCAHTILGSGVLQVPDLLADPRFAENPVVVGGPRARFYAGAPLVLPDGSRVGALCVMDYRPRLLDESQLEQLRSLADEAVSELLETKAATSDR